MSFGGSITYFVDTVFNYPTLAEAYKIAALNGLKRVGIHEIGTRRVGPAPPEVKAVAAYRTPYSARSHQDATHANVNCLGQVEYAILPRDMVTLESQIALVTGGAKRIGRATALALAREGVNVVVHYGASKEDAETLAHEIERIGIRAWTVQGDLSDPDAATAVFEKACAAAAGKCDI